MNLEQIEENHADSDDTSELIDGVLSEMGSRSILSAVYEYFSDVQDDDTSSTNASEPPDELISNTENLQHVMLSSTARSNHSNSDTILSDDEDSNFEAVHVSAVLPETRSIDTVDEVDPSSNSKYTQDNREPHLNPVAASFRMAANMILSDASRQALLDAPDVVTRLRYRSYYCVTI